MQHISLRPIQPADEPFLYQVYASTRGDIVMLLDWAQDQKEALIRQQFTLQHNYYQEHFPDAAYDLVLADELPIGRLYLDRHETEFRILDITLLPEERGKGIGGYLMRQILDEAAKAGKPVRIHVEQTNGARRLYDRLGFKELSVEGMYFFMEWQPDDNSTVE